MKQAHEGEIFLLRVGLVGIGRYCNIYIITSAFGQPSIDHNTDLWKYCFLAPTILSTNSDQWSLTVRRTVDWFQWVTMLLLSKCYHFSFCLRSDMLQLILLSCLNRFQNNISKPSLFWCGQSVRTDNLVFFVEVLQYLDAIAFKDFLWATFSHNIKYV